MRENYEYLRDSDFLEFFDKEHLKEQYAKITILDWLENPIQDIQGIVTGGTITIDGNSSIRRTCNLSVFVNEDDYSRVLNVDNLISINKKVRLEIGFKNNTDRYTQYDMIWFPQGIFVVITPSISHSTSGTSISLQLKDKMCLLNGECGGTIPASTQFDEYETVDENGNWIIKKPVLYQIITEVVNHFGGEQLGKILISDLDTRVKQVMKWTGNTPVYLINRDGSYTMTTNYSEAYGNAYQSFEYGEDIGFIYTDFIYPNELIGDAGSTVCTILDKIKSLLGNYEYFYDIDGNFHFQEIKNYLNTSHATVELEKLTKDDYIVDMSKGKTVYTFDNSNLITSYSNNPQYNMIKNDFVVWGIRENANGNEVPIRYHLAIDKKPKIGNTYECFFYEDPDDGLTKAKRPIIYRNFNEIQKTPGTVGTFYMAEDTGTIYIWKDGNYVPYTIGMTKVKTTDWRTELYLQGVQAEPLGTESNYYYTELLNEWPKLYDIRKSTETENGETVYTGGYYDEVLKTPSDIDFYLDFIDSSAAISQFSISNIGRRTIVENDNDINCVFEPDIPDFVLIELGQDDTDEKRHECEDKGQNYIQVDSSIYSMLAQGGSKNSAYVRVRELLYQYTSYNESITLQAIPIYHLEPNIRIGVRDIESSIFGDYMISTISIPLDISGTMTISATRALERL